MHVRGRGTTAVSTGWGSGQTSACSPDGRNPSSGSANDRAKANGDATGVNTSGAGAATEGAGGGVAGADDVRSRLAGAVVTGAPSTIDALDAVAALADAAATTAWACR